MEKYTVVKYSDLYEFYEMDGAIVGITHKLAGNFAINGSSRKAIEFVKRILEMTEFNYAFLSDRAIAMRAEQHTDKVMYIPNKARSGIIPLVCDGIIYRGPGAAVFFPGGCPGIAFRDKEAKITGLLHAGWKPVTKWIITKFLRAWEKVGGKASKTEIFFLPSICEKCLTYDAFYFYSTVLPHICEIFPHEAAKSFYVRKQQKVHLRLNSLIKFLLKAHDYHKYFDSLKCTCCDDEYWCYRKNDTNELKRRNAAFIITP